MLEYTYYKKGSVITTTAGAQTNYQLKLLVSGSSGDSTFEFFDGFDTLLVINYISPEPTWGEWK